jgi:hypothetical protein
MIAGILNSAGYPTQLINEVVAGSLDGVAGAIAGTSDQAVEIWVIDPEHIEPAKRFLAEELQSAEAERARRAARTGTVSVTCEECAKESTWPAAAMGTTEVCPHCGGYMDVPDPDDNWSDIDFGASEDEETQPKE